MTIRFSWAGIALGLTLSATLAQSAIDFKDKGVAALSETRSALGLPMKSRLEALRAEGASARRNLLAIMFDHEAPMSERWKATTALGRIEGGSATAELERAMSRKEWFMRSAGLLAMTNVDRAKGIAWARKLLSDKALLVRASAVDALANAKDAQSAPLLWKKLYAKENYDGGESLWIRRKIIETLAKVDSGASKDKFVKALRDKDPALHASAAEALAKFSKLAPTAVDIR